MQRRLLSIVSLLVSGFPFGIGRAHTVVERLRRYSLRERFREHRWYLRILLYVVATLGWPLGAALEVRRCAGSLVQPSWRERARMYRWALLHNVPPLEYAVYKFDQPQARSLWAEYLYWPDGNAVKRLNRLRGADNNDVQDKLRFAEICERQGLPHVRTVDSQGAELKELPPGDLWVKSRTGTGSAGAAALRKNPGGYSNHLGAAITAEQLLMQACTAKLLIQPRLRNHVALEPLTNGALASLRIVTAYHRTGEVSFLANTLLLPQQEHVTSAGGAQCAVEWESGTIRKVTAAREPELADRALGAAVPDWKESLALVERAHRAFPRFATLGWDVALTTNGPLLLETNSGWGALGLQQLWGPMGLTTFSKLLEEEFTPQP